MMHQDDEDEWGNVVRQIANTVQVPYESGNMIPWFSRPPLTPPSSPRTTNAMNALEEALLKEVTWRTQIPNEVFVKLRYGIDKILSNNGYREKLPNEKDYYDFVDSVDRTMLSLSNSIDEYLEMSSFKNRIADAIKYKSFISKV